jgi:hypothetical protein
MPSHEESGSAFAGYDAEHVLFAGVTPKATGGVVACVVIVDGNDDDDDEHPTIAIAAQAIRATRLTAREP